MSFSGVLVPVATPFHPDLSPDKAAFLGLCQKLLDQGAGGLAVFGTTSEANSLGLAEKRDLLDYLVDNGIPPEKLMPGTGTCALPDTIAATSHAVQRGCGGVLLLPPFYYKGVSDDGLFDAIAKTIEGVDSPNLRVYLYHIPPVAQVPFSLDLVGRLKDAFPQTVVGLKDSGGDWAHTEALLTAYPDLQIFPGSEVFLLQALRLGGAGCITATANVNLPMIRAVFENWQGPDADEKQAAATAVRQAVQNAGPLVPVIKSLLAHWTGQVDWSNVRPPLTTAQPEVGAQLAGNLAQLGVVYPS
ncbi:MAG: dihydrodipicolinate synthase family protein [Magnetospiraceae bacterium]